MLCIKPLPADAGRFGRVCFDVLKYGVLIHRPACGAEITPSPEMTAPVSLLQFGKLHLDFARSASLHTPHDITHRMVGWDRNEHVDMVRGQHPLDDGDPNFLAYLSGNLANSLPDRACQHLLTVLGDPDEVVAVMIYRVFSLVILHDLGTPVK